MPEVSDVLSVNNIIVVSALALVAVIKLLWAELNKHRKKADKDLEEQKAINKDVNDKVINLSERVGHAEGYKDGVDDIAASLIRQVKSG